MYSLAIYDAFSYPYASKRNVTYAANGMVATSQPLAAQVGLDILKKGGNAIDAAIATAACLTVVEPTSNGIGSDCFAIVWMNNQIYGLNGSGQAPQSLSIDAVNKLGYTDELPRLGMTPVTVPGSPGAWAELSNRFGVLPFEELLQPAIEYAENGFPLSPTLAKYWNRAYTKYKNACQGEEFQHWFDTFAPEGRAPQMGEIWSSKNHAKTLREIALTKSESFYRGNLAQLIDDFFQKHDGFLRKSDLESYKPIWVNPISIDYQGYKVWEIPPNGQGLIALEALKILEEFNFKEKENIDTYHKQIEALKLAFVDGMAHITDEKEMKVSASDILSDSYISTRRAEIKEYAHLPKPGNPLGGGTVYIASADREGNMVSFIQSNYNGFGSGIVVPNTGIAMQNRGHNFSLNKEAANALMPGKRTYHTIIPGFLSKGKNPIGPFGVMGEFMQPQGHLQVIMNAINFKLNPQSALDAPRWMWKKEKEVFVEPSFSIDMAKQLEAKGHDIQFHLDEGLFGRGQIIWRDPDTGVLQGGTESRTDGCIAAW
ncbi:gamma-glutamyltransferase family protein [Alkalihalobacillus trypoxylicola]|uniref:Gamma-glutamyltransferase n=2 Tax=Alkalihalobacillus trypoxylicola TaxID=519424 RepID=A0A162CXF1_9BACI|nr:gamma-glutamyltransferase family protein [Alkalihalobacillus trypoxylicola]KYG27024.1 gamma-glutamyltransferase [Alkalihalobacillus trypoxylicola]